MRTGSDVIDRAPPSVTGDGGGGGGWAWLVTAQGIIEAELIRGLVESAGVVPVALDTSDPSPGAWLFPFGNVNALVRIFVPASQLDRARLAMLESGFDFPDPAEPRAPAPRRPRSAFAWIWIVLGCLILVLLVSASQRVSGS